MCVYVCICDRLDVSAYVGKQILKKIEMFDKVLDSYTMGLIALTMKSVSCNAGYKLFQANDTGKEIYIQRSGRAKLRYDSDLLIRSSHTPGGSNVESLGYDANNDEWDENEAIRTCKTIDFSSHSMGADPNNNSNSNFNSNKRDETRKIEFSQSLQRGNVCGELSLVYKTRQYTLDCQTWCEFYVIDIEEVWSILEREYPNTFKVS